MFKKVRRHVSSAHLIALMALFVALGATAWAVERNSIGTKHLKTGAVKASKIARGAVTTPKLRGNAVTGAKVNEATLGQVPSAATAGSASSAANATNATNATNADDSEQLEGRALTQVRSLAVGVTDTSSQGLDESSTEQVMAASLGIPAGGADLVLSASVELVNNSGGQRGAQCQFRNEGDAFGNSFTMTLPVSFSTVMSMTGFINNVPGSGVIDPRDISVHCVGSGAADDVSFAEGTLVVERIPTGA